MGVESQSLIKIRDNMECIFHRARGWWARVRDRAAGKLGGGERV